MESSSNTISSLNDQNNSQNIKQKIKIMIKNNPQIDLSTKSPEINNKKIKIIIKNKTKIKGLHLDPARRFLTIDTVKNILLRAKKLKFIKIIKL